MTFANPLPAWALAAVLAAALAVAWFAYSRVPISRGRRYGLSALRLATLSWIVLCLMRPMIAATDRETTDAVVAVLVDGSRSMGLADFYPFFLSSRAIEKLGFVHLLAHERKGGGLRKAG